jgi:plastocyanin
MEETEERLIPGRGFLITVSVIGILVGLGIASFLVFQLNAPVSASPPVTSPNGSTTVIAMPLGVGSNTNLNFGPPSLTVVVGVNNTIEWVNQDTAPHTASSSKVPTGAQPFDSGTMAGGAKFNVTLTVPGTYLYYCKFHNWMQGTIVVKAASA